MRTIIQKLINGVVTEFRDAIHGNRNLGEMMEQHYAKQIDNIEVNEEEIMKIPAVVSAVELISSSIASLPIRLYRKDIDNEIVEVKNDRRVFLLNRQPNSVINSYNFKKRLVQDYLLYGGAMIKKTTNPIGNKEVSLHLLDPKAVKPVRYYKSGYVVEVEYEYENDEVGQKAIFDKYQLIRVLRSSRDGVEGIGLLEEGEDVFKLAINENNYSRSILENGALPLGALSTDATLTKESADRLRDSFDTVYKGTKNAGKTLILEQGLTYKPISLKPNDLDLSNSKKATLSDIARIFNVPESMINSEANKYSSNEQNNIHFLQYCITPIIASIENALNQSYLEEKEKMSDYFFEVDTSDILKTTEKDKIDAAVSGLKGGILTINEARQKLNLKDITDRDYYMISLGGVFVDAKTGRMTIPNLGRVIDPNTINEVQLAKSDIDKLEKLLEEAKDPDIESQIVSDIYNPTKEVEENKDILINDEGISEN